MPGSPPDVAQHVDDRAAVAFHPLAIDLAREQKRAVQVVAHDASQPFSGCRAAPTGTARRRSVEAVDPAVALEHLGHVRCTPSDADGADVAADVGGAFRVHARDLVGNRLELRGRRPINATRAPRLASSCTVQRPRPLPPPVTITSCHRTAERKAERYAPTRRAARGRRKGLRCSSDDPEDSRHVVQIGLVALAMRLQRMRRLHRSPPTGTVRARNRSPRDRSCRGGAGPCGASVTFTYRRADRGAGTRPRLPR